MALYVAGIGCFGEIIKTFQTALVKKNYDIGGTDGIFGHRTLIALRTYLTDQKLSPDIGLTPAVWKQLTDTPSPSLFQRALQLESAFEWTDYRSGDPFGLVVGDFDDQGLTWGVIGFTLVNGEIGEVLAQVDKKEASVIDSIAGAQAEELRNVIHLSSEKKRAKWGEQQSCGRGNRQVKEPWATIYCKLGQHPLVRQAQIERVIRRYWEPAVESARSCGLRSGLGYTLCFDIHIQNGRARDAKKRGELFDQRVAKEKPATEMERRRILAQVIADTCKPKWQEDVLRRKLVFTDGKGSLHGYTFDLMNWGIDQENEEEKT